MVIIYIDNEGIKIMSPNQNYKIEMIADKDVPIGLFYKIYDVSQLPTEPKETWELEINQSNADGIGLTQEEFDIKYPEYKGWSVK
jgi:hypothetical protein